MAARNTAAVLALSLMIIVSHAQPLWLGTWSVRGCKAASCCCLSEAISVTASPLSPLTFHIDALLVGASCASVAPMGRSLAPNGPIHFNLNFSVPDLDTEVATALMGPDLLQLSLSSNELTGRREIYIVDTSRPGCSMTATTSFAITWPTSPWFIGIAGILALLLAWFCLRCINKNNRQIAQTNAAIADESLKVGLTNESLSVVHDIEMVSEAAKPTPMSNQDRRVEQLLAENAALKAQIAAMAAVRRSPTNKSGPAFFPDSNSA